MTGMMRVRVGNLRSSDGHELMFRIRILKVTSFPEHGRLLLP
jgi:hypothetical protein